MGEEVLIQRTRIIGVVGAVSSTALSNMRAVYRGAESDHILVNHSAQEGIATYPRTPLSANSSLSYRISAHVILKDLGSAEPSSQHRV